MHFFKAMTSFPGFL